MPLGKVCVNSLAVAVANLCGSVLSCPNKKHSYLTSCVFWFVFFNASSHLCFGFVYDNNYLERKKRVFYILYCSYLTITSPRSCVGTEFRLHRSSHVCIILLFFLWMYYTVIPSNHTFMLTAIIFKLYSVNLHIDQETRSPAFRCTAKSAFEYNSFMSTQCGLHLKVPPTDPITRLNHKVWKRGQLDWLGRAGTGKIDLPYDITVIYIPYKTPIQDSELICSADSSSLTSAVWKVFKLLLGNSTFSAASTKRSIHAKRVSRSTPARERPSGSVYEIYRVVNHQLRTPFASRNMMSLPKRLSIKKAGRTAGLTYCVLSTHGDWLMAVCQSTGELLYLFNVRSYDMKWRPFCIRLPQRQYWCGHAFTSWR